MTHINIEFKAKCSDPEFIRNILKSNKAKFKGTDQQIDTYFNVPFGRLKLREGNIETALIHYERLDQEGPKQSDILLYHPDPKNIGILKEILLKTLGLKTVVNKQREIYFIGNVKFHIDNVQKLGSFIEVEAIDIDGSIGVDKLEKQCYSFLNLFNVSKEDLVAQSYSDLLLKLEKKI